MEDLASLWSYQESIDELKQRLFYTTIELESVKAEANEEMKKHKEFEAQTLQMLKVTTQQRDEARDELLNLLNNLTSPPSTTPASSEILTPVPQILPESPLMKLARANSTISESRSFSQNSSPVDPFPDTVASPELSDISNLAFVNQPFVPLGAPKTDQDYSFIDNIVKEKTLPHKGKLLEAVMEAGPLLQTLLVAGPLPQWRNPPPLQNIHIPPVSIKSCEVEKDGGKAAGNSQSYDEMSCGNIVFNSMPEFRNGASGSSVGNGSNIVPNGKKQRFH